MPKTSIRLFLFVGAFRIEGANAIDLSLREVSQSPRELHYNSNDSNGLMLQSFEIYNCDGIFTAWSTRSPTETEQLTVVSYDYDVYIKQNSNVDSVLSEIESGLLRYVGDEIFSSCERRQKRLLRAETGTEVTRQLTDLTIKEITSNPGGIPYPSTVPCQVQAAFHADADCFPIAGAMSVYYSPTGDKTSDEMLIHHTINDAIKRAMDGSSLVSDEAPAVYFVGVRNSNYDSAEEYLDNETGDTNKSWLISSGLYVICTALGILLFFGGLLYRKKKKKTKNVKDETLGEDKKEKEFKEDAVYPTSVEVEKSVEVRANETIQESDHIEHNVDDSTVAFQKNSGCCVGGYC